MFSSQDAPPSYNESQSQSSLTDILPTPVLRSELALLLLLCTDSMRKDLLSTFELPPELSNSSSGSSSHVQDLISLDENRHGSITIPDEIVDRKWRREQDLRSSQLQGLNRASVMYFDAWRGNVLKRVCEVLGLRAESVRGARKVRQQEITKAAAERESSDLLSWAQGEDSVEARSENVDANAPKRRLPAIPTKLLDLEKEKRLLLLNCVVLLLLSLESYPAHSRVLLQHLCASFQLPPSTLLAQESAVASTLLAAATQLSEVEKRKTDDSARKWKVGLATVAGAGLLAVTGGLAAPLLAAGLGTVLGGIGLAGTAVSGLLGTLAGSSVLIGGLFGAMGGRMTGRMVDRYAKEVEDFKFLAVKKSEERRHKLRVAVGISGWVTEDADVDAPWKVLSGETCEPFALRWELEALLRLGVSLKAVIRSYVWQYAGFELARRTLLGALAAGLWPLGLLKMAKVIDNPFSVGISRADKAGKVLAEALIARVQGERPVTLVGYSLGAKVIYSAMLELAAQNTFGLVENVILVGTPAPSDSKSWTRIRSVVCGRVVNVHSTRDYILGLIYRASSIRLDVAGLQAVEDVNGVENFDVTHLVESHDQYRFVVGQILKSIGFEDVDDVEVQAEREALQKLKAQQKVQSRRPSKDAETEAAEVVAAVEEQTGVRISAPVDEQEEWKKEELVQAAEKQGHGDTPTSNDQSMEDRASNRMQRLQIDDLEQPPPLPIRTSTTRSLNKREHIENNTSHNEPSNRATASACQASRLRNEDDFEALDDEELDEEPQTRIRMVDMEFLEPEPVPDSD